MKDDVLKVSLPYEPRPWQKRFHSAIGDRKRAYLLWARRHGKDVACWNHLLIKALEKVGSYYYLFPMQTQARKALWEGMTASGFRFIDFIPKALIEAVNNSEMRITLVNGSLLRVLGSDNFDALRGGNPIGVVFSEYAFHHPTVWQSIVEPILQENRGWALFNTTPYGKNHGYELWQHAQEHPELWYTEKVTISDSNLFPLSELDDMRSRGVSEEVIQQEYFCSFDRGVEGSYYGRILADMHDKGKIKDVPYDEYLPVHTAWDLGYGDSTAIAFIQLCGNEIHIIDYYEAHGEGLAHYMKVLEDKRREGGWTYGEHYVPHDAASGSFEIGMSRVKYAAEMGLRMTVLPRERVDHGIERVRRWLPKCYFDKVKTAPLIKSLEGYRKTYNEKLKVYSETPLHSSESHGADCWRYACFAIENCHSSGKMSIEEYRKKKAAIGLYGPRVDLLP